MSGRRGSGGLPPMVAVNDEVLRRARGLLRNPGPKVEASWNPSVVPGAALCCGLLFTT
jgi:hypothetical protein